MKKPRTKAAMVEYLTSHFRYDTMNSWNAATSYAQNIKAHRLNLDRATEDAVFAMLDVEASYRDSGFNHILREFDDNYHGSYQIGTNGRSGGYLVLYQGGEKPSEHKSYCRACGQRNFTAVPEGEVGKCGRCGEQERVNATFKPERFTYPGKGMDMDEDFSEWSAADLRDRVDLVWDFDRTCQRAVDAFVRYAKAHSAEEETVLVPKKIMVAVRKRRKAS